MQKFNLVNIRDIKEINKIKTDPSWKASSILPYYGESFVCFTVLKEFSFEELMPLFLFGKGDNQIGAISVIAEQFPSELYHFITQHGITQKQKEFLLNYVVWDYLPLVIPPEKRQNYVFNAEYQNNIWVKVYNVVTHS